MHSLTTPIFHKSCRCSRKTPQSCHTSLKLLDFESLRIVAKSTARLRTFAPSCTISRTSSHLSRQPTCSTPFKAGPVAAHLRTTSFKAGWASMRTRSRARWSGASMSPRSSTRSGMWIYRLNVVVFVGGSYIDTSCCAGLVFKRAEDGSS